MDFKLKWHSQDEIPIKDITNDRHQLVVYAYQFHKAVIQDYCLAYYSSDRSCWVRSDDGTVINVLRWCYLPAVNVEGSIQQSKMTLDRYGFYHTVTS